MFCLDLLVFVLERLQMIKNIKYIKGDVRSFYSETILSHWLQTRHQRVFRGVSREGSMVIKLFIMLLPSPLD